MVIIFVASYDSYAHFTPDNYEDGVRIVNEWWVKCLDQLITNRQLA